MGPPEFTGGNFRKHILGDMRLECFNGAAGIHRRKPAQAAGEEEADGQASMGPPEFTGGNPNIRSGTYDQIPTLQWGRRNSPAETRPAHADRRCPPELQWGRRNSPAETGLAAGAVRRRRRGFNGAAGIHRRKPGGMDPFHTTGLASMGPPEFTGGNARLIGRVTEIASVLQWGRRNSPAETWRPAPAPDT